jgi:hypothetical protein
MNKKISIDLNRLRINGVKYLNDLLVDDIMTKVDLSQFEELIKQLREEINKKADKEHTHTIDDIDGCDTRIKNVEDKINKMQHYIITDIIDHNCEFTTDEDKKVFTLWLDQIYTDNEAEPVVFIGDEHGDKLADLEIYNAKCDYDWSFKVDINFNISDYGIYPTNETDIYHIYLSRTVYGSFSCESLGQLEFRIEPQYSDKEHTHTIDDIEGCSTRIGAIEDKTRTITSTIDNLNKSIQLDQSLISEHEGRIYNLEEATNGVDFKNMNNLIYENQVNIAAYDTRLTHTESKLKSVEDKTQMMTSTANELTINTNGGYPLKIYGATNYTRLVLGSNDTNCLYLGYNKPLNLAYLKTNGGGEVKVSAADLECSNLNLKVSGTISSPTITNLETTISNLKTEILKSIYPVGAIYTSMTSTNPATLFGFGTWSQIKDRFLYCTTSSKSTGGSKKITIQNLPAHTHNSVVAPDINGNPDGSADSSTGTSLGQCYWRGNKGKTLDGGSVATSSTGGGTDYMPPYITCYAWYRTA